MIFRTTTPVYLSNDGPYARLEAGTTFVIICDASSDIAGKMSIIFSEHGVDLLWDIGWHVRGRYVEAVGE